MKIYNIIIYIRRHKSNFQIGTPMIPWIKRHFLGSACEVVIVPPKLTWPCSMENDAENQRTK